MKTGIGIDFPLDGEKAKEVFTHLRLLGYECADLQSFAETESLWFTAPDREKRWREIGGIARDAGISICQTHGPWRYPPRDFTPEERAERFEKMSMAVEGTCAVGAPYMVIHNIMPFGCEENPEPERFMDMNREYFSRLLAKARACGVGLALENMPFPNLILSTPGQVLSFVKEFDTPAFHVCLDTGHAALLGCAAGAAVREVGGEYLACLHVHDNDGKRDMHWFPYRGVIDWSDFSAALKEIGYGGTMSLETHVSDKLPDAVKEAWELALARTARYLTLG